MLVVVIMITLATMHSRLATQMVTFRDMMVARGPAMDELRKAPRVMSDEISCWRSVEMFHPPGTSGSW
jgi:hypothetical protein